MTGQAGMESCPTLPFLVQIHAIVIKNLKWMADNETNKVHEHWRCLMMKTLKMFQK